MSGCSIKLLTFSHCCSSLGPVAGPHESFFLAALNPVVFFVCDKLFTKALITLTLGGEDFGKDLLVFAYDLHTVTGEGSTGYLVSEIDKIFEL